MASVQQLDIRRLNTPSHGLKCEIVISAGKVNHSKIHHIFGVNHFNVVVVPVRLSHLPTVPFGHMQLEFKL